MFNALTERFNETLKRLRGQGRITEENVNETLGEIRRALLEADVALPVVKSFTQEIQTRAVGQEVVGSLNPGQAFTKIVYDELVRILGTESAPIKLEVAKPIVILMAGLQGSGKTTTVAKLAKLFKEDKQKVLVASCDIYRPAAMAQLETLAKQIDVAYFPADASQAPTQIATAAVDHARRQFVDIVIIDTAGRLHIDDAMMKEITALHSVLNPAETLFVVDSMTGQDAANSAKAFHEALPLTGVVLTKVDGDARGGAALSVRYLTGKPIKYIGVGEKTDALELFHPDRIASRILDMGDVLSLVEEVERKIDKKKAEKFSKKIRKGQGFDLEDFREQLQQMSKMGNLTSLLSKLPGMGGMAAKLPEALDDKKFSQIIAIINSMTFQERRFPQIISGSRKKRIAGGSGTQIQDINRLLKQFTQMQKIMKKMGKPGAMQNMMRRMQGMFPGEM